VAQRSALRAGTKAVTAAMPTTAMPTTATPRTATPRRATHLTAASHASGQPEKGGPGKSETEPRRCGWCRKVLPQQGSVGRPRQYCGQSCRQRAYEQRTATAKAGLPDDVVVVRRAELDGLQDRLYQLRCALEDVQTLLGEKPTKAELERSLADLVRSTGRLDRLWVTERAD
jgi:hypothetical protein